jgi:hypothetical protein
VRQGDLLGIQRVLGRLAVAALAILTISIPFISLVAVRFESEYLHYLLATVFTATAVAVSWIILTKWQHLIDPPMFLSVLLFALLTISAYLLSESDAGLLVQSDQTRQANTFGASGAKVLSGLMIMASMGLFYLTAMFSRTNKQLKLLNRIVFFTLLLSPVLLLLFQREAIELDVLVTLSVPVLILFTIWSSNIWWMIAGLFAAVFGLYPLFKATSSWQLILVVVLSWVAWLWVWLFAQDWKIDVGFQKLAGNIRQLKLRKISVGRVLQESQTMLAILVALALLIGLVIWIIISQVNLGTQLAVTIDDIRSAWAQLTSTRAMIFGTGAQLGYSYNTNLAYVIHYQGMLGILGYLILGISAWWFAGKQMWSAVQDGVKNIWPVVTFPFIFALPLVAVLSRISVVETIMWWLILGLTAAYALSPKRSFKATQIKSWGWRKLKFSRFVPLLQLIIIILLIVTWVVLTRSTWSLIVTGVL